MSGDAAGGSDDALGEEDASSLVDAVFGAAKPKKAEAVEADPEQHSADSAKDEAAAESAASAKPEPTAEPTPSPKPDSVTVDAPADAGTDATPSPRRPGSLRARLVGAATVLAIAGVAGVLVLTGSGSSKGSAGPAGAPVTTQPSVNPQAFYPATQHDTPFATGPTSSVLTDDALRGAVPGCGGCKLVTRANGFTPDGGVLALFRTGDPAVGKPNFKLVVVGQDGKLVWSAPPGVQALTSGIERFSTDAAGNYYLALPGSRSGYILIALAWRDGKVLDLGDLLHPKVSADAVVGILPEPTPAATATIVAQTRDGVPDATTGGLIESQYQIRDGAPVLIGCRRHVGESGEWVTFQPDPAKGCVDAPPGPVGPPDDDETSSGP